MEQYLLPFLQVIFINLLNMSITASYVIVFVVIVRLFLKKVPKIFSYILWSIVLFRLVCPFSFESAFSLLAMKTKSISQSIAYQQKTPINSGILAVDKIVNQAIARPAAVASVNPLQVILFVLSILWLVGIFLLLMYGLVSYLMLKRKVNTSMRIKEQIYVCENIDSPFVLGIVTPKIYVPMGLSKEQSSYIINHEQVHIHRFDHIIKPFAFLTLCVHWFNPFVWVAFILMSKDMEMSCDEKVLNKMGQGIKKEYSMSLLSFATNWKMINASPLAFGESNVKSRIKNILNYKKPALWMIIIAIMVVVGAGIGLTSDPKSHKELDEKSKQDAYQIVNTSTITEESLEEECLAVTDIHSADEESGFSIDLNIKRWSMDVFEGQVREVSDIILKQYVDHNPVSSTMPSWWQREFDSSEEIRDYLGCDMLIIPTWDIEETMSTLTVCGDEEGNFENLCVEMDYLTDNIRMQSFSYIFTDSSEEDSHFYAMNQYETYVQEEGLTPDGFQYDVITSSENPYGYISKNGFLIKNGVLYNFHLAYTAAYEQEAEARLVQWFANF